jgi:predicted nucleic acid-binding protein
VIVISDTSVISGLIKIQQLTLLKQIFSEIILSPAVRSELDELQRFGYDLSVLNQVDWITERIPSDSGLISKFEEVLDRGEAEAIALAKESKADFLLLDEKKGRRIAEEEGLTVIGSIGILIRAKQLQILPKVKPMLDDLIKHNFRISTALYQAALKKAGE